MQPRVLPGAVAARPNGRIKIETSCVHNRAFVVSPTGSANDSTPANDAVDRSTTADPGAFCSKPCRIDVHQTVQNLNRETTSKPMRQNQHALQQLGPIMREDRCIERS